MQGSIASKPPPPPPPPLLQQDIPICERYVCPDPENDVQPLTGPQALAQPSSATPRCSISDAQIQAAVAAEAAESGSTFLPAALCICALTLFLAYVYEARSKQMAGEPIGVWSHAWAWLACFRVFDIQTDFGFYFISLRGAFGEAYGDGDPATCPSEEPKVAAVLYASVFFTALGLFLTPLDIWATRARFCAGSDDAGREHTATVLGSVAFLEDLPQLVLSIIYLRTMASAGIDPDAIAIASLLASGVSLLFNIGGAVAERRRARRAKATADPEQSSRGVLVGVTNPTYAGDGLEQETGNAAALEEKVAALARENDALKGENGALKDEVGELKDENGELKGELQALQSEAAAKTKKKTKKTKTNDSDGEVAAFGFN